MVWKYKINLFWLVSIISHFKVYDGKTSPLSKDIWITND